jgi:hypothetical protein
VRSAAQALEEEEEMASNQWGGTATAGGGTTSTFSQSSFPVQVTIERQSEYSKLYAVPILGFVIKGIMLIPHIIALYILVIVSELISLVLWIPVLTGGQYPPIGFQLVGGTVRWSIRVYAFLYGLTDRYPPFSLGSDNDGYPVNVTYDPSATGNKLYAIPIVGIVVRAVMLIPHLIVLYILAAVIAIMQLGLWVPVLMSGQYPDVGYSFVGGYLRWAARVAAFMFGLTDTYPPFRLGE